MNVAELEAFLLGELAEADAARIEDHAFSDSDVYETLLALEDELFERYLSGELDATRKARFEARFLADAKGRERLASMRALQVRATREKTERPAAALQRLRDWLLGSSLPVRAFAMAGVAVLIAVSALLYPGRSEEVAFLSLSAEGMRGGTPPELIVPEGVRRLRLELAIDPVPPIDRFQLELVRGKSSLWSGQAVSASKVALMVEVELESGALVPGDYALRMKAREPRETPGAEILFSVVRPSR